jgi:hypothetical protein
MLFALLIQALLASAAFPGGVPAETPSAAKVAVFLGAAGKPIMVKSSALADPIDIAFDVATKRVYAIVRSNKGLFARTWDLSGRLVASHPLPPGWQPISILYVRGKRLELLMGEPARFGVEWRLANLSVVNVPWGPSGQTRVTEKVPDGLTFDNSLGKAHAEHVRALMRKLGWFSADGGQLPDVEVKRYRANARDAETDDWVASKDYSILCFCWGFGECNVAVLQTDGRYRRFKLWLPLRAATDPKVKQPTIPRFERVALSGKTLAIGTMTRVYREGDRPPDDRWKVVWLSVGKKACRVVRVRNGHLARVLGRY